jgi:hypothetical protein
MRPDPNYVNATTNQEVQIPSSASAPPIPELSPFGTGQLTPPQNTALTILPPPGEGIMGGQTMRQYLMPIIEQVQRQNREELRNKIEPYVQEVQQITDRTFPDLNLSDGGLRGGLGGFFENIDLVRQQMLAAGGSSDSPFGVASFLKKRQIE